MSLAVRMLNMRSHRYQLLFLSFLSFNLLSCKESTTVALFQAVENSQFTTPGAQPNAWSDFDNDGDLDLFVGMRGQRNRLYRNDNNLFTDIAPKVGLDDAEETRAASWGDFNADGHLDLYIGFTLEEGRPNRLYRNEGDGQHFTDVAETYGVDLIGNTRQSSFIDYDNDGDIDLFIAFREQPNRLFRNDGDSFTDVSETSGIADPRKSVGVAWFDVDEDGDLDAFVANQNGDNDGVFINTDGKFKDRATELGMDGGARTEEYGGVGPAVTDFDNDGDLDIFVAMYGPDFLYRKEGNEFTEVGSGSVIGQDYHSTVASWGDFDNDGWQDIFVASYLRDIAEVPDHLFRNVGGEFIDVTPGVFLQRGASHGVQWADFDGDGDLDLSLANNNPEAYHPLYENKLSQEDSLRSLKVQVLDANGFHTLPGAEVRLLESGSSRILGTRLVDTGSGYCSQSVMPVHFGLPKGIKAVDLEVTVMTPRGRRILQRKDLSPQGIVQIRVDN